MKKLALAVATLFLAATPALACPDMESGHGEKEQAPRTAEKDKAKDSKGQEKAKEAPKAKEQPKTAKPEAKPAPKSTDKVSSK